MMYYYLFTTILAFISFVVLVLTFEAKKVNYFFLVILLLMAMANGGYLSIALSDSVGEAILANKICYLGGCFIPPVTLFLLCSICNYHVSATIRRGLYLYSFVVYIMVLTIGHNDFYYDSVSLDKSSEVAILEHTYGVGHAFFYVILYGYVAIQLIIVIYSMMKKKVISVKYLCALLLLSVVNIALFVGSRVLSLKVEIMPLAYVIDGWIFLYMYRRSTMYSIEDNINAYFRKQETYGYIIFDQHLSFLGSNEMAVKIFPMLAECRVDRPIENVADLEVILNWLNEYVEAKTDLFDYERLSKHYECRIEKLIHRQKSCGYIVEMREDTDTWKYMSLLSVHNAELERFQTELESKVDAQTNELRLQQQKTKHLFLQTVTALSEAVDAKDRYTSGHSKRVAKYAKMIAERLGKSKEEQEEIYRAGLLHDVGKIRVPAEIINKPGKLTDEEFNIIKIHPITGYHILRGISEDSYIAVAAKYHHERYDGKGYPNGLVGENIPEVSRILGVADSYDAMASNRSYRNALPQDVVRSEIEKGRGTQFDPVIADIMLQMIDEDKNYDLKQVDSLHRRILTVDDETMNNKIITHIMRDEPMYEVVSACSGQEALELLEQQHFDLVLLDVRMPGMDGLETLKWIRQKHDTPVVLMTSEKTLDISLGFSKYGCDDYITKPFLPLLVKEIVHNMTERTNIENP